MHIQCGLTGCSSPSGGDYWQVIPRPDEMGKSANMSFWVPWHSQELNWIKKNLEMNMFLPTELSWLRSNVNPVDSRQLWCSTHSIYSCNSCTFVPLHFRVAPFSFMELWRVRFLSYISTTLLATTLPANILEQGMAKRIGSRSWSWVVQKQLGYPI